MPLALERPKEGKEGGRRAGVMCQIVRNMVDPHKERESETTTLLAGSLSGHEVDENLILRASWASTALASPGNLPAIKLLP